MRTPAADAGVVGPIGKGDFFAAFRDGVEGEAAEFGEGEIAHSLGGGAVLGVELVDSGAEDDDQHKSIPSEIPASVAKLDYVEVHKQRQWQARYMAYVMSL